MYMSALASRFPDTLCALLGRYWHRAVEGHTCFPDNTHARARMSAAELLDDLRLLSLSLSLSRSLSTDFSVLV